MKRGTFVNKRFIYGSNALFTLLVLIILVTAVNLISGQFYARFDTTREKQYSLSQQTRDVLQTLKTDIEVLIFSPNSSRLGQQIRDIMKEYQTLSGKITYRVVEPDLEPALVSKYQIAMYDTVVMINGGRSELISPYEMGTANPLDQEFRGEQALTRGILALTRTGTHKIYYLNGHEERSLAMELPHVAFELAREGFTYELLNLMQGGSIPEDAAIVMLVAPKRDLEDSEVKMLEQYLTGGGRLLVYADPRPEEPLPQFHGLLSRWGIILNENVVVDPDRHYYYDAISVIPEYAEHPVTWGLLENEIVTVMPFSQSLSLNSKEGYELLPLFTTSDAAWGETTFDKSNVEYNREKDLAGPLTLAAALSDPTEKVSTKVVVVGTSSVLLQQMFFAQGNRDFFLNTVHWMVDRAEEITIRPQVLQFPRMYLSGSASTWIFLLTVLIIPLLILGTGVAVWLYRRRL